MRKDGSDKVVNLANFGAKTAKANSPIASIIKSLSREVRRHRLTYDQLRFIFKSVRQRCEVEPPNRGQTLYELPTSDEMQRFYAAIEDPVHRLIFEFLDGSGLRVSELCNLEVSRIDFKGNTVFVKEGKGRKDRVTVIGNQLLEKLRLYLAGRNNRYLFESNRHTRFSSRRIEQLCKHYRERANIERQISPHSFRHRWNTFLAEGGISREGREILAGHAKGSATQDTYTHLGLGGIKNDVIAILDRVHQRS
ncbi:MAG: tyrosine-type recombinase/integrase [Bdellovibrionales bacterium]